MSNELRAWLTQELKQRRWSQGELARQTGVSRSFITQVLSGDVKASVNFCHKIAAAFGESPETVLRLAGILPPAGSNETLQQINELARNLSPEDQSELLEYARFRFQRRKG